MCYYYIKLLLVRSHLHKHALQNQNQLINTESYLARASASLGIEVAAQ